MNKVTLAACAAALVSGPALAQESPKALQDAFAAAVVAEDAEALAALYTDGADSYDPSGGVQKGRAEISANWRNFFSGFDGFTASLDQQGEHAMKRSHAAWGLWSMSATPIGGGEPVVWNGRFLDVSIKTADGWRYVVDHASMLAPPPEKAPATE